MYALANGAGARINPQTTIMDYKDEAPQNIKPLIEIICGRRIEISRTHGLWRAMPLELGGATGLSTGGPFETIDEYLTALRRSHAYNDAFHGGVTRTEAKRTAES